MLRDDLPLVEELQAVFRAPGDDFNAWYEHERELYESHGLVYGENDELDLLVRLLRDRGTLAPARPALPLPRLSPAPRREV